VSNQLLFQIMSWDVFLMSKKIDFDSPESQQMQKEDLPSLGKKEEIIQKLTQLLPDLDYSDTSWGLLRDNIHSIEFNTGAEEVVASIMLHIRGGGNPAQIIEKVCTAMGWYALDCSTGEYLQFDQKDQASFEAWQGFRDKIVGRPSDEEQA